MTSLPAPQTIFLQTVEEPKNNSINFRNSLKFFQEQLAMNGAGFPPPSPVCRAGKEVLKKNGHYIYPKKNSNKNGKKFKDNDIFEDGIESMKSCKLSIPTVDTILESVKVLRAIQKSQKEQGSTWNLDITLQSESNSDFKLTSGWIPETDTSQDSTEIKNNCGENGELGDISMDAFNFIPETETNGTLYDVITDTTIETFTTDLDILHVKHSFWLSNTLEKSIINKEKISSSDEQLIDLKVQYPVYCINAENLQRGDSTSKEDFNKNINNERKQTEINILQKNLELSKVNKIDTDNCETQNSIEDDKTKMTNSESWPIPETLRTICRNLLTYVNEKISNTQHSKEIARKNPDALDGMLHMETYGDAHIQNDNLLLNVTAWKGDCSPDGNTSTKLENNDSDSGIGNQRSISSLPSNISNQIQKHCWSDTYSSQRASVEYSDSLDCIFKSSKELNQPAYTVESTSSANITYHERKDASESQELTTVSSVTKEEMSIPPMQITNNEESGNLFFAVKHTNSNDDLNNPEIEGEEQYNEESHCFISNYILKSDNLSKIPEDSKRDQEVSDTSKTLGQLSAAENKHENDNGQEEILNIYGTETVKTSSTIEKGKLQQDFEDIEDLQEFIANFCDFLPIIEKLYSIKEGAAFQTFPADDEKFEEMLYILSKGAFSEFPEAKYFVKIKNSILYIMKGFCILLSLNMKYGEVSFGMANTLIVDNRMGRWLCIKCEFESLIKLKTKIELHCLKHWQSDSLHLVQNPLSWHQKVIIIDLGSCSTRAGILMDQSTLPTIFFPTICATNKKTGKHIYGMEALQPEVRKQSNLSFPICPSDKITKIAININMLEGLFKKIFIDLKVDPSNYTVQVCLPRHLSIDARHELVALLLEDFKVKSVTLANQTLLTLYAHNVSTAIAVNIGDGIEVLPVVDGFIVESGITKLPYGGQRLIHHMKHNLVGKDISLSSNTDSFVVQYIIENLAYIAQDYDKEMQMTSQLPHLIKKTVTLPSAVPGQISNKTISLDEARFKVCEGLFNPGLWGIDNLGIHQLVFKAIRATGIDARKKIAQNIYISGGVAMLPGFVERLRKEVHKLSEAKLVPKVIASNYRYHCTYIGACTFARMEVFPQVCINLKEYRKDHASALKKCALCM